MRKAIEDAGGLKLVYIDPPFDVGADFSFEIEMGDGGHSPKQPSVIEEIAYRDTWGRGTDSYCRHDIRATTLIHDFMHDEGAMLRPL